MLSRPRALACAFVFVLVFVQVPFLHCSPADSWRGILRDAAGNPVGMATVKVVSADGKREYSATISASGQFVFAAVAAGDYMLTVSAAGKIWTTENRVSIKDDGARTSDLQLTQQGQEFRVVIIENAALPQASGGEHLSTGEVSSLPLNERDFGKLLLLAAGTMTDTNGAANFTQQFAVNGQRGSAAVFAMDGADTTDPELGGATFSNFNVDAIQEVQSNSGVLPAEIGHGGASFTNVITRSGTKDLHGSVFEFVRNAALDARNYFDHVGLDHRRIPPFIRNEFGGTIGGPVMLPGIHKDRTFFFGEYQGFRQILGTTQVFPVPTADERLGID